MLPYKSGGAAKRQGELERETGAQQAGGAAKAWHVQVAGCRGHAATERAGA